jgi:hypothetical protein
MISIIVVSLLLLFLLPMDAGSVLITLDEAAAATDKDKSP